MKRLLSADYIVRIMHQCNITVVRRVSAAIYQLVTGTT